VFGVVDVKPVPGSTKLENNFTSFEERY